ncbi:MAG: hypothetical protein M1327_06225 [Candidatus Thermoplasmatota archaeon]|nr:hypothetical protein [Candidatus Thermoplasmatota archaeon]
MNKKALFVVTVAVSVILVGASVYIITGSHYNKTPENLDIAQVRQFLGNNWTLIRTSYEIISKNSPLANISIYNQSIEIFMEGNMSIGSVTILFLNSSAALLYWNNFVNGTGRGFPVYDINGGRFEFVNTSAGSFQSSYLIGIKGSTVGVVYSNAFTFSLQQAKGLMGDLLSDM